MSEGIRDPYGQPIVTKLVDKIERDAHGNIQLSGTSVLGDLLAKYVKQTLKMNRVRTDTFGYLQRSFNGCISEVDQQEAREVGERAAQYAIWYNLDGSVTINRTGNYSVDYRLAKLEEVAGKTRCMPDEYINGKGNQVTDKFKDYVLPLVGTNLETSYRLRAPKVEKILHVIHQIPNDASEDEVSA